MSVLKIHQTKKTKGALTGVGSTQAVFNRRSVSFSPRRDPKEAPSQTPSAAGAEPVGWSAYPVLGWPSRAVLSAGTRFVGALGPRFGSLTFPPTSNAPRFGSGLDLGDMGRENAGVWPRPL